MFGAVHGHNVALLVDTSDASFGFGRQTQYIQDLTVNDIRVNAGCSFLVKQNFFIVF